MAPSGTRRRAPPPSLPPPAVFPSPLSLPVEEAVTVILYIKRWKYRSIPSEEMFLYGIGSLYIIYKNLSLSLFLPNKNVLLFLNISLTEYCILYLCFCVSSDVMCVILCKVRRARWISHSHFTGPFILHWWNYYVSGNIGIDTHTYIEIIKLSYP